MGYFANGDEGDAYYERYCSRCAHSESDDCQCPVWDLHMIYNYKQHSSKATAAVLGLFIPREGGGNAKCVMFVESTN
jgi:hypothetical protein